ncbi:MAG: APC family permease [Solirubrobacteraceae bacterium]
MEGATAAPAPQGEPGLKANAIGFASSVVIGVASTAPGYSLAAVLGLIVAVEGVGVQAPAVMIASFIPILCVAWAYRYLNRADPDCGTTFSWAAKAFGPSAGWIGGWAIIVADIIVMANLAQIAGLYTFLLFDSSYVPSTFLVTAVGVIWIAVMTWVCVIGIELNAKTQRWLLTAEIIALAAFSIVALIRVFAEDPAGSIHPELSWFSPFAIDSMDALVSGVLIGIFIYWGWDSLVTVNEETEDSETVPGRAAVVATLLLLGIYVVVSTAAVAFGGPDRLANDESGDVLGLLANDVFGSALLGKVVIIAVLTSAAASTQTTILPTARTSLSMARKKAIPARFAHIHREYLTPDTSTIWMGALSIVWYVGLTLVSEDILFDSIAALGLMIAFYYGLTGFACVWYFRRELTKSVGNFVMAGILPLLGGLMLLGVFIKSCSDLAADDAGSGTVFGLGSPLVIGIGFLLLGPVLMLIWRANGHPEFFRMKPEVSPPGLLEEPPPPRAPISV